MKDASEDAEAKDDDVAVDADVAFLVRRGPL